MNTETNEPNTDSGSANTTGIPTSTIVMTKPRPLMIISNVRE